MISEATPPGTDVLTIEASDADLDPKLRFYLTGPGAESFSLERNLGTSVFFPDGFHCPVGWRLTISTRLVQVN